MSLKHQEAIDQDPRSVLTAWFRNREASYFDSTAEAVGLLMFDRPGADPMWAFKVGSNNPSSRDWKDHILRNNPYTL